jgi:hypothetical protein
VLHVIDVDSIEPANSLDRLEDPCGHRAGDHPEPGADRAP